MQNAIIEIIEASNDYLHIEIVARNSNVRKACYEAAIASIAVNIMTPTSAVDYVTTKIVKNVDRDYADVTNEVKITYGVLINAAEKINARLLQQALINLTAKVDRDIRRASPSTMTGDVKNGHISNLKLDSMLDPEGGIVEELFRAERAKIIRSM